MTPVNFMLCLCVCVCMAMTAKAQGTVGIRDHDKSKQIELQSMKVDCKVASRFAHTTMTTKAFNVANDSQEVFFDVDLPKTAFITNFTIEIEGQVYISEVKEKEKARQQYEKAVSSGQSAGLVKAFGRHMEKFSVSVNVAAQSLVTFTLTYEELLRRRLGSYEIMIGVRPKQLVQNFEIVVDINEPQGITFVDVNSTFITNELFPLVEKVVTVKKAHVYFSPTLDQQRQCPDCEGTLIDGDFFIKYDVNHAQDIGEIQIVNGYFVHFFAPENLPQIPKNVVFVIDRSGSMEGEKMKQTREALLTILSDLHEDDYFGLVTFDDVIESWRPSLSKATPENVSAAKKFVKTITARHFTDINKAVLHAVDMLTAEQSESLPDTSMIILLTDGRPSAGEQDLSIIQKNVHDAINGSLSLFCLGFGNDLDYSLLDTMAKQNDGLARRIYEGSDATLQLQGFYEEVASPLLLEVNLSYPGDTVTSLTDIHFKHFFAGSEIVVAGRLQESEIENFITEVSANGLEEQFVVKGLVVNEERDSVFPDQEYIFGDFMEHLWAYLTIQQLLDKRDRCSPDEKDNITAEALDLSLRYHFVTPLTSMVVTKPQTGDEETLIADKLTEDEREDTESDLMSSGVVVQNSLRHQNWNALGLSISDHAPPRSMSSRRLLKPSYSADGDPHFIIELPDQNDALCFNFDDKPGTIFNLVRDPLTGIVVNGQIIGEKKEGPGVKMHTYFGSFGIVHKQLGVKLMVSTKEISVSEEGKHAKLLWSTTRTVKGRSINLKVMKDQSLMVTLRDSVKFLIILHKVWKNHPYHQDYLGFYTLDSHLLSKSVHGLLGQFYHGVNFEVSGLIPGTDPGKQDAIMFVKGKKLTVTRGLQKDFRQDVKNGENVPCWFIHNNGIGLLDGLHTDYIVSDLFKTI
ncbi:inter-alpha-trypsin inhibitor heavy chain H3 [Paramisgurnus dabryanus]|uniref:inter-alpha-trypsin inhibitor heavy chain H3 n=1 Tax=Paramisgurnus dabryanus TaxID=90735 RepID=UPI0031F374E3